MKFRLDFERTYPHPPTAVWRALTDPAALGAWLMETDFVAEPDRAFTMWCGRPDGGTDRYHCQVLALDPPRRMLWSWVLDGRQGDGETRVEFRLEPVDGGTRLTVRHSGDRDRATIDRFGGGWPVKLDDLAAVLGRGGGR